MFKKNKKEKFEYVFSICKAGSHNSAQVLLDLLNENGCTQKESKVHSYNFIFQIDIRKQEQKLKKDQHERTHYEIHFRIKRYKEDFTC